MQSFHALFRGATLTALHGLGVFMEISLNSNGHWRLDLISSPSLLPKGEEVGRVREGDTVGKGVWKVLNL